MPTDNPKISLYVPQQIYNRFKSFQEERKLSMSQAGIVIIAEYFGIEETIKEITEGTTIGGVTLAEFEQLKQKIEELRELVNVNRTDIDNLSSENQLKKVNQNKTASSLPEQKRVENSKPQLELLSESSIIKPIPASHLCVKRFGLGRDTLASYKRKHTQEELAAWTKEKDPDNIAWALSLDKKGYIPKPEPQGELLNKLQNWIKENIKMQAN
jgi:hypothetical protein